MSFRHKSGDSIIEGDFSQLEKLIAGLGEQHFVDVGILGDRGAQLHPDSEDTIAQIGAKHEFGSLAERIPKRSFILMPIERRQGSIKSQVQKNLQRNLATGNVKQIYKEIGVAADGAIQEAFETGGFGQWAALSDRTIENKGSSAILIDTGTLRKSVTSRVDSANS